MGEKIGMKVAGEWIESTRHHPVWVVEGKNLDERPRPEHVRQAEVANATVQGRWVDAGDLWLGDVLLLKPDRREVIEDIRIEFAAADVYNFQVEALHNYAVGFGSVLVHNNAWCQMAAEEAIENGELTEMTEQQAGLQAEGHHSDPIFMEGDPKQPLTEMSGMAHDDLHGDLNSFLKGETDELGNTMSPSSTNSAEEIQSNFTREQRLDALARFYQGFGDTYPDAASDFFSQHPELQ